MENKTFRFRIEILEDLNQNAYNDIVDLVHELYPNYEFTPSYIHVENQIIDPNKIVFVAKAKIGANNEEKIVGMCFASLTSSVCLKKGTISELVVLPMCRRNGVARQLFKRGYDYIESTNPDVIDLIVHSYNDAAIALYNTFDFEFSSYTYMRKILNRWPKKGDN